MEEGILKTTTAIALAVASIALFGSGFARAELDETTYIVTPEQSSQYAGIEVEETPVVLEAKIDLPKVTVTCSAICQFMNGTSPPPSTLDFINTSPSGGGSPGGGGNPPPPPAPPPVVPKTKDDCNKDCAQDRTVRDLKCSNESYALMKSLQTQALNAARAKLILKGIKNPYVDFDMLPDIVLFEIDTKQKNFKDFCENVAVQAQLACYETCTKLGSLFGLPFLILPAARSRRQADTKA